MRLATWNVLHGAVPGGRPDLDAFGRACASLRADLLALQEVDVRVRRTCFRDLARVAARAAGMQAAFGVALRVGRWGRYGNALLARGDLSNVEVVALPRPRQGEPRSVLLATARMGAGGPLLSVAATHLSVDRAEAPGQLERVLARLADRPAPRVLLGDLNLRPDVAVPMLAAAGFDVPGPDVNTYPAGDPSIRIDYVAVDGLEVASTESRRLAVSDHCALVCEVTEVTAS